MLAFFGAILCVLGRDYLIEGGFMQEGQSMVFYVIQTCLYFAVYLAILQLGVRTFVAELTASFQGIADKLLPGSVPGVDCAVIFGFGAPNAVTLGFLAGFIGQIVAIATLVLLKSPVLVICGFVPVFFDNATIGVFVNEKGGLKATLILPFISGLCQVFGSALIAGWVGMAASFTKKVRFNTFRLEVLPFCLFQQSVEHDFQRRAALLWGVFVLGTLSILNDSL